MKRLNLEADIRFTGTERQQRNGKNAYPSKSKSYDRNFNRRFDGRNTRRGRVGIGNYEHLCRILKQKSNESNQMQLIQLLPHPRQISIRRQNASYNCITNRITANDQQCRRSLPLPAAPCRSQHIDLVGLLAIRYSAGNQPTINTATFTIAGRCPSGRIVSKTN